MPDSNYDPFNDPIQDPDNYWMNTFYYNREDKRLFPPRRVAQMGWTVNFAHPAAPLLVLLFLAWIVLGAL